MNYKSFEILKVSLKTNDSTNCVQGGRLPGDEMKLFGETLVIQSIAKVSDFIKRT